MTATAEVTCDIPAREAAIAWLNTFLATSDEKERPSLHQTIALEIYESGVLMICTDGRLLLRTWTPSVDGTAWPLIEELPLGTLTVMDTESFGIGFMRTLLRATNEDGEEHARLNISTSPADEGATLSLGAEFMSERASLRACGQRIDLRLFEGEYPNWRDAVRPSGAVVPVEHIALNPTYLSVLGKLREVSMIDCDFYGQEKPIHFRGMKGGVARVVGMLAPMRRAE